MLAIINKKYTTELLYLALFFLLGFFLYWPTIQGGAFWDDYVLLFLPYTNNVKNPLLYWIPWKGSFTTWPVFYSFIWILKKKFGQNFQFFHCVSIILHSLNTWLVYLNFKKYFKRHELLLALIFLTHPVHIVTVTWIIQIKTLLLIFFVLLATLSINNNWLMSFFVFLGVGSKTIAFTVVPFLVHLKEKRIKKNLILIITLLVGVLSSFYILFQYKLSKSNVFIHYYWNFVDGIYSALLNYLRYVLYLIIPTPVTLFQKNTEYVPSFLGVVALILGYGLLGWFIERARKEKFFLPALLFFTINIFPLCGIIYLPIFYFTNFAEYWLSYPILGILVILWIFLEKKYVFYFSIIMLCFNFIWVYREAGKLTNIEAFFENSVEVNKDFDNRMQVYSLAQHYAFVGKCEKAEEVFEKVKHHKDVGIYCIPNKIEQCYKSRWSNLHDQKK